MSRAISLSRRVKAPEAQVFERGEVGNDAPALHHLRNAPPDDPHRIAAVDPLAVEHDLAARHPAILGLEQPGNGFQRGRLAGAIGAEQRHHRPAGDVEAEPAQYEDHLVVYNFDVVDREKRRAACSLVAGIRR